VKLKVFIPISIMLIFWAGCATKPPVPESQSPQQKPAQPDATPSTIRLDKKYFVIHYDPQHRQARYVEYRLRAEDLKKSFVKREDRFHVDSDLLKMKSIPVDPKDYLHTGYDRGHLAPSGDFEWSEDANDATFTMANMSPQKPQLNRSAWRGLEEAVRNWACSEGELRIVTGPLFDKKNQQLKPGITIPNRYFKVILDETPPRKAIGFILEQEDSRIQAYKQRTKSVREVEEIAGINFFKDLPKTEQDQIEAQGDLSKWKGSKCKSTATSSN
jgi:endonuclease G